MCIKILRRLTVRAASRPAGRRSRGFTLIEALFAMAITLAAMAIVLSFFVDFGEVMNTESSTLAAQQAARTVLDELTRNLRQVGYDIRRPDPYNPTLWQRGLVYAGSHVVAFNANIDATIGGIPPSESISFPTGPDYDGEATAATILGAETLVYTLDADANGAIEVDDRTDAAAGNYNPAASTDNPLDFALFRRIYGFNGTDYGGELVPMTGYLFTNATSDIVFPDDGTSPDPLFVYWMTEDINEDGILSPEECVNDAIDGCSPTSTRNPELYVWGDSDFDGVLSETEKTALRTMEVGSTAWTKMPYADSGTYKSTTLATAVDPSGGTAYELQVTDGTKFGPGYHIQIGTGANAETFFIEEVVTSLTPDRVLLTSDPKNAHTAGTTVQVLPSTAMRAVRAIAISYSSITDKVDLHGDTQAAGRSGRHGTGGLDYRVTTYNRKVELVNAPTAAMIRDKSAGGNEVCPLEIVNACSESTSEESIRYASISGSNDMSFLVTDTLGNPISDASVQLEHSNAAVGSVSPTAPKSDADGKVTVYYTPSGATGTDTVTATVSCYGDNGVRYDSSATNKVEMYNVTTQFASDCLSTISPRTPYPTTEFVVSVTSEAGPLAGHEVELELQVQEPVQGRKAELLIGGSPVGQTAGPGARTSTVSLTTDGNGQILGAVSLIQNAGGSGAGLRLRTTVQEQACAGATSGNLDVEAHFFSLLLESTSPYPGCTEYTPCTISESSPPPRVMAQLSIFDEPVQEAPLEFTTQDTFDFDLSTDLDLDPDSGELVMPESLLFPPSGVETDEAGQGSVTVKNNGSMLISPDTPLITLVDVASSGPANMCANGSIGSSSLRAGFIFEAPSTLCKAELLQPWIVRLGDDKLCLHVLNDGANNASCPIAIVGTQIDVTGADGVTPDPSMRIKQMTGGAVTSSPACSDDNKVTLFKDKCKNPQALLANGEPWMFEGGSDCQLPPLYAEPQSFFTINKLQFDEKFADGSALDVTVFYECLGECSSDSVESATFKLMIPLD